MIYALLISFSVGLAAGYQVNSMVEKAKDAEQMRINLEALNRANALSRKLQQELIDAKSKRKVVYKTIIKEVKSNVSEIQSTDSICNLSVGVKRLFDSASMSRTTGNLTEINSARSDIREIDLIKHSLNLTFQYNEVAAQCNALIKWYKLQKH